MTTRPYLVRIGIVATFLIVATGIALAQTATTTDGTTGTSTATLTGSTATTTTSTSTPSSSAALTDSSTSTPVSTSTLPSCTISASPASLSSGQSSTLTWSSTFGSSFAVDQVNTQSTSTNGSVTVTPFTSTTYTGRISGANGSGICQVTVFVNGVGQTGTGTGLVATSTSSLNNPNGNFNFGPDPVAPTQQPGFVAGTSTVGTSGQLSLPLPVTYPTLGSTPAPMILNVEANGHVVIRGTVASASANTITINSWGGLWTIRVTGASSIIGAANLGSIPVGNFVGVDGFLAQNQAYTVDATVVRDWTTSPFSGTREATGASDASSNSAEMQTTPSTIDTTL